jgi:microcystin-dependent protein
MATHVTPAGATTVVPAATEIADGPKAFTEFADSMDAFLPPVGTIVPFMGTASVGDWLLCDGSSIDAKYSKLINIVGANTPNLKGKFLVGMNIGDSDFSSVKATGGAKSGSTTTTITTSNLPQHTHTATADPDTHAHTESTGSETINAHAHGSGFRTANNFNRNGTDAGAVPTSTTSSMDRTADAGGQVISGHTHSIDGATHTHTVTIAPAGGVASPTPLSVNVSTLPPFYTVNYLIRAA